jgi:phytoene synthase
MELYSTVAYKSSALLTRAYSTSFSMSSLFFPWPMRRHIYAVYGLVRIADEIVDTYKGTDAKALLDSLEQTTYRAIDRGYDPNPIVQAFAETARQHSIGPELIKPFFNSMRIDLNPQTYNESLYKEYIHGSAEVVGLMCLRVFCHGNDKRYMQFKAGAAALGSAYQKVNFLRDMADDYKRLGRVYFPAVTFATFNEADKQIIIADIEQDFKVAHTSLMNLPKSSRVATLTSFLYYQALLRRLKATPAHQIKQKRVRVPDPYKIFLLCKVFVTESFKTK